MAGVEICPVTLSINSTGIVKKLLTLKGQADWAKASQSLGSARSKSLVSNPHRSLCDRARNRLWAVSRNLLERWRSVQTLISPGLEPPVVMD